MARYQMNVSVCPFCGGTPKAGGNAVFCTECHATGPGPNTHPADAVRAWNRRVRRDIIPCPFCGGCARSQYGGVAFMVRCTVCGARTREYYTEKEAIEAWEGRGKSDDLKCDQ